jgi:DNA-binding NarL/FixJ family response regulator
MIKVAIADDHAIVRQGLKQLLLMQDNMAVVGEAANHVEVMHTLRHQEVDTLLLDIAMPGRNGIDILKQLRPEFPKLPVLILSMYPENQYAIRALKAGASGYLTKMAAADQLVDAIRQITAGRKYITTELAQSLADHLDGPADASGYELLSDREFQTLRLIASGNSLMQIGTAMSISPKTVSVYRSRLLAKLRLANNAELTRYAFEQQLVQ